MISRRTILGLVIAPAACRAGRGPGRAAPIPVVASFSILGDLVKKVGGNRIAVSTLVGPDGDAHVFQPAPADAKKVAAAKVVFVNGLGFEGWMERLVKASGTKAQMVTASTGVQSRQMEEEDEGHAKGAHSHEIADPHAVAVGRQCQALCRQYPRRADRRRSRRHGNL